MMQITRWSEATGGLSPAPQWLVAACLPRDRGRQGPGRYGGGSQPFPEAGRLVPEQVLVPPAARGAGAPGTPRPSLQVWVLQPLEADASGLSSSGWSAQEVKQNMLQLPGSCVPEHCSDAYLIKMQQELPGTINHL